MSDPVTTSVALLKTGKKVKESLTPEIPTIGELPEPTVIPLPDDEAAAKARRRSLLKQGRRGGRASTILSTSDTLG